MLARVLVERLRSIDLPEALLISEIHGLPWTSSLKPETSWFVSCVDAAMFHLTLGFATIVRIQREWRDHFDRSVQQILTAVDRGIGPPQFNLGLSANRYIGMTGVPEEYDLTDGGKAIAMRPPETQAKDPHMLVVNLTAAFLRLTGKE